MRSVPVSGYVLALPPAMDLDDYKAQPGPTITTIGRWHDVANGRGVGIFETDDQAALARVLLQWNEAVDFEISLVHDDDEAHALIREHLAEWRRAGW